MVCVLLSTGLSYTVDLLSSFPSDLSVLNFLLGGSVGSICLITEALR